MKVLKFQTLCRYFLSIQKCEKITALVELHNVSQINVNFEFYELKNYVNHNIYINFPSLECQLA